MITPTAVNFRDTSKVPAWRIDASNFSVRMDDRRVSGDRQGTIARLSARYCALRRRGEPTRLAEDTVNAFLEFWTPGGIGSMWTRKNTNIPMTAPREICTIAPTSNSPF